jgi:hypothetical protein|tara:strand:+ start:290 stop:460 length:171 start_codon:yes stop_codon:yes gene_type:complete
MSFNCSGGVFDILDKVFLIESGSNLVIKGYEGKKSTSPDKSDISGTVPFSKLVKVE